MSLHGSLQTFALPDVLTLLASTKKTGELRVTGPRLDGRVWVVSGQLVGAVAGRATDPVDAVFELLRLAEGDFSFEQDEAAPRPAAPRPLEPVVAEAQARLADWQEIAAVVPSLDVEVRLVPDAPGEVVTMPAGQWRLIVAAATERNVGAVADRLGLGEFAACRAVKELVEAGLCSITGQGAPTDDLAPVSASVFGEVLGASADEPEVELHPVSAPPPVPVEAAAELFGFVDQAEHGVDADDVDDADDEPELNRGLLLKFLSSVRS